MSARDAVKMSYQKPHGHRGCGKGQYKSMECKAKSIRKNAIERGEATRAEQPYIQWLADFQE